MIIHYVKPEVFQCEINDAEDKLFRYIYNHDGRMPAKIRMCVYLKARDGLSLADAVTIVNKYLEQF